MFEEINSKYPDYFFRFLMSQDYHRGLFDVLNQLTKAPAPAFQDFVKHLDLMQQSPQEHINIVGLQKKTNKIVAFGTVLICHGIEGTIGKIQNIVTCKSVRGKGLGRCIIDILKWLGWQGQCSKITLFCQQKNVVFYNKLGFEKKGVIYAHYR